MFTFPQHKHSVLGSAPVTHGVGHCEDVVSRLPPISYQVNPLLMGYFREIPRNTPTMTNVWGIKELIGI